MIKILLVRPRYEWASNIAKALKGHAKISVIDFKTPGKYTCDKHISKHIHYDINSVNDNDLKTMAEKIGDITHVIIAQRLDDVSEYYAKYYKGRARVFFTEAFFGNNIIFDEVGLQYMPVNEIPFETRIKEYKYDSPIFAGTRERQPVANKKIDVSGGLVIFEQVYHDKSLYFERVYPYSYRVNKNIQKNYKKILDDVAEKSNTDVYVKRHPRQPPSRYHEYKSKVKIVDAPISQLLTAKNTVYYAFSSTVIYEAAIKHGKSVMSSGFHLMTGVDLKNPEAVKNRHNFLWQYYTVDTTDTERLLKRLQCPSEEWYK